MDEIVSEVTNLIVSGFKEITLLGQNVNSYGHDITKDKKDNSPFIKLISELDKIPGDYRIYFYSNHPKDMTDELIKTIGSLKHFPKYIHLPLQSGNDEILREMNRHNTKKNYQELVVKIREIIPEVTLTTDIIVGYPGETNEQFEDTAEVMRNAEYDMAFIAQYSPRSGTVSAKETDSVPKDEKKRREAVLQEIVKETVLKHNQQLVGTTQKVLIDEQKGHKFYGRTEGYKVVEIKTDQLLTIGQFIDVKIESASSWKLLATIE
jgi:tRNA-2-methylthio-N6-dimethylallyladenosine synthase